MHLPDMDIAQKQKETSKKFMLQNIVSKDNEEVDDIKEIDDERETKNTSESVEVKRNINLQVNNVHTNKDDIKPNNLCGKVKSVSKEDNVEVVININSEKVEKKEIEQIKLQEKLQEETNSKTELLNIDKECERDSLNKCVDKEIKEVRRKRKSISIQEKDVPEESTRNVRKKIKGANDEYCWRCHKEYVEAYCSACPRSWHRKCMGGTPPQSLENWICGECATILRAENAETRSTAMAQLSVNQLCMLLKHVVEVMREYPGSEPFWEAVDPSEAPNYMDYIVKPMHLSLLESNVRTKLYGSTDAFMADAKWIQHNCIVFNTCGGVYTDTSKLTNSAKQLIKLTRQEVSEIEACPDCYAHGRNLPRPQPSWFIEPCRRPHTLVWAKLKGFPFWPAKAMPRVNAQGFVDVRFFGEHDRAWVPPKDLYLYSQEPPAPLPRKRKLDMDECLKEITEHCRILEMVFGEFKFAPPKIQYNPNDPMQIKLMLPNYDPNNISPRRKSLMRKYTPPIKVKPKNSSLMEENNITIDKNNKDDSKLEDNASIKSSVLEETLENSDSPVSLNSRNDVTSCEKPKNSLKNKPKIDSPIIENKTGKEMEDPIIKNNQIQKEVNTNGVEASTNKLNNISVKINNTLGKKSLKKIINSTFFQNLLEQKNVRSENSMEPLVTMKKISTLKSPISDTNDQTINATKVASKNAKNSVKVYKPKARIVDKLNAEKAIKNDKSDIYTGNLNTVQANLEQEALSESRNDVTTSDSKIKLTNSIPKAQTEMIKYSVKMLDRQVNNKKLIPALSESKDQGKSKVENKKESKARKSLQNKPPEFPQLIQYSSSNTVYPMGMSSIFENESNVSNNSYQLLPPEAGPLSAGLYQGAHELARRMAQLMEEQYKEAAQLNQNFCDSTNNTSQTTVHFLRLQIERMRWQHQQQLAELKHNADRVLREMKASLEVEKLRAIEKTRREADAEKKKSIEETKRKQWCAKCGQEAMFYCCWNTAYCDYPCQQSHWPIHMRTCAQQPLLTTIVTSSTTDPNQQQVMPKLLGDNAKVNSSTSKLIMLPHSGKLSSTPNLLHPLEMKKIKLLHK